MKITLILLAKGHVDVCSVIRNFPRVENLSIRKVLGN